MVVDAACKKNCETFQTLLDNLLLMLHTYVSAPACSGYIIAYSVNELMYVCECRHVLRLMSTTLSL